MLLDKPPTPSASLLLMNSLDSTHMLTRSYSPRCSKLVQMSFAARQGLQANIDNFRNSAVMTQKKEWHPILLYTAGPLKGKEAPFPSPDSPAKGRSFRRVFSVKSERRDSGQLSC
jgi:hypothetical protein